jgi:hypothetical protein
MNDIHLVESNDPLAKPWHVALVRPDGRPAVRENEERYVMAFPHRAGNPSFSACGDRAAVTSFDGRWRARQSGEIPTQPRPP